MQRDASRDLPSTALTARTLPWPTRNKTGSEVTLGSPSSAISVASSSTLSRSKSPEDLAIFEHGKRRRRAYRCLRTIGTGTQGTVKEALCLATGKRVALKAIRKAAEKPNFGSLPAPQGRFDELEIAATKDTRRKFGTLGLLRHTNLLDFIEHFETEDKFYIVTELCAGDLRTFLNASRGLLSETHIRVLLGGVLRGIEFLHSQGIVHRYVAGIRL